MVLFRKCFVFFEVSRPFRSPLLLLKHLSLLLSFFIPHVSQEESDGRIMIVLFGLWCFAISEL